MAPVKKPTKKKSERTNEKLYYFSQNPEKRWGEIFFLMASIWWLVIFGLTVATKIYLFFEDIEFLTLGLLCALPYVIYPLIFPPNLPKKKPIYEQYWFKANVWIFIFGFVGNYFWTHYFFKVLHATYEFPVSWKLNQVPICLYFITHAYFCMYHTFTNICIRIFWQIFKGDGIKTKIGFVFFIFVLSYFTAFMEAFTISSVPYYIIEDRTKMYTIGSVFYGIYFYVSFPAFFQIDEEISQNWTITEIITNSLSCTMIVTLLLDFWRLFLGAGKQAAYGLPWL